MPANSFVPIAASEIAMNKIDRGSTEVTSIGLLTFLAGILFGALALLVLALHFHRETPEEQHLAKVMLDLDREARLSVQRRLEGSD
jgi:hypothetical protein